MNDISKLISNIKIIDIMDDYNFGDILRGTQTDIKVKNGVESPWWLHNRLKIQKNTKTILGIYFNNKFVSTKITEPGYNSAILKISIDEYIRKYKPLRPNYNDCCVYFRLGDVVMLNRGLGASGRNQAEFDYIGQIRSRPHEVINIVCCFAFTFSNHYGNKRILGEYLEQNKSFIYDILYNIKTNFPDSQINIQSSTNVDDDICYLYESKFISHPTCTWKQMIGNF